MILVLATFPGSLKCLENSLHISFPFCLDRTLLPIFLRFIHLESLKHAAGTNCQWYFVFLTKNQNLDLTKEWLCGQVNDEILSDDKMKAQVQAIMVLKWSWNGLEKWLIALFFWVLGEACCWRCHIVFVNALCLISVQL